MTTPKVKRRGIYSWMMFDWAAQPFHTLLITFIFAPYFTAHVAETPVIGQQLWGYAFGAAGIIIALFAPVFGAMADISGQRKPYIAGFSVFAILGAATLYLALPWPDAPIVIVLIALAIALIGVEFATVFTNAMMPSLVSREELGKLSGTGWALGYTGGIVALIIVLGLMSASPETGKTLLGFPPVFGLDPASHAGDRASGPLTAIWYFVFIIPMFLFTPDAPKATDTTAKISDALRKLRTTIANLPKRRSYFAFLISSMIYRDGLNALYAFGGIYAAGILGFTIIQIGVFGIVAAIAGAIGAFIGGHLDTRIGARQVVFWCCWALALTCVAVVSTTQTTILFVISAPSITAPTILFYIAGASIGAFGGALQAASRTLLIDQVEDSEVTEAFGLYALTGRATSFIAPLAIAVVTGLTANQRIGITPIIVLLVLGAIGLFFVKARAFK